MTDDNAPKTDSSVKITAACDGGEYLSPKLCKSRQPVVQTKVRNTRLHMSADEIFVGNGSKKIAPTSAKMPNTANWSIEMITVSRPTMNFAVTTIWSAKKKPQAIVSASPNPTRRLPSSEIKPIPVRHTMAAIALNLSGRFFRNSQ